MIFLQLKIHFLIYFYEYTTIVSGVVVSYLLFNYLFPQQKKKKKKMLSRNIEKRVSSSAYRKIKLGNPWFMTRKLVS